MRVVVLPDSEQIGRVGADIFSRLVTRKPDAVLGIATGSSPASTYAELALKAKQGIVDFSRASAFALDEYIGLEPGHPEAYSSVVSRTVTEPLLFDPSNVRVPDAHTNDHAAAALAYEKAIADSGGIDLQIAGIGVNGHVGFNEPLSSPTSRTRVVKLSAETRASNARFFARIDDVPTSCLTQGLGTILDAREIILIAIGDNKARAVAAALEGPISSRCPASVLQTHPAVTVLLDPLAASRLLLPWTARHNS